MAQQLQLSQNQIAPQTRPEIFFSLLYGSHMKQYPKRSGSRLKVGKRFDQDRQWVFVGTKEKMKSVATQATLFAVLADPAVDTTYFTPNGYFRRDQRVTESLRWLNSFILDIDNYGLSVLDMLDRIESAGLPRPTAIVKTPSGGHHVHFFFTCPVRATKKAERLYTAIMWHMANDLAADLHAVGANRIFRTPTEQNLIYFEPSNRYDFDVFKNWRDINHPFDPASAGFFNVQTDDLMSHPALQHLLTAPCDYGRRDVVAFNLALAMKASGWTKEQAESALKDWFISCCAKGAGPGKKPFTQRDATYKAVSVYRCGKLHAPKAEIIRELTGLPFFYQTRNHWESAKPRSDRERSHLYEWKGDLLMLLASEKELSGTQQELATRLGCPLTSFKAVLGQLKADGKVVVETRRGRGGITIIRLPEPPKDSESEYELESYQPDDELKASPDSYIIHIDFQNKQIKRIERLTVAPFSEQDRTDPDPDSPD